jgi:hypothetical protein
MWKPELKLFPVPVATRAQIDKSASTRSKVLAQSRKARRLEPVVLARTIEAHHGAPVGHIDARRCRLAANIRVIGIRNLSGCSPLSCPPFQVAGA